MNSNHKHLLTSAALLALSSASNAALIVQSPTGSTNGSAQITQDITLIVTTAGQIGILALDEWVASDGSNTSSVLLPDLSFSVNGITQSYTSFLTDNLNASANDLTSNDGYFFFGGPTVSVGDIITFSAATYNLIQTSNFNPQATQTFSGNAFIATQSGIRLSNTVPIPEPSSTMLIGLGTLCLVARRQKK